MALWNYLYYQKLKDTYGICEFCRKKIHDKGELCLLNGINDYEHAKICHKECKDKFTKEVK